MNRRVVVTGVGLVSPVGMGTQANWDALCAGTSGIGPITRFDAAAFSTRFAGEVKNFDPLQFIEKKELKKMDIFIQFAVAASQYAVDDAKLTIDAALAPRIGVFIGSGIGGFTTIENQHSAYLEGGPRKISPFFIPSAIINLAAGQVSIRFGAAGDHRVSRAALDDLERIADGMRRRRAGGTRRQVRALRAKADRDLPGGEIDNRRGNKER